MKKIILVLSVIFVMDLSGAAQIQQKSTGSSRDQTAVTKQGGSISSATNIEAQLQNSLDVRRARPGDPVVLKTTRAVKQNGQTVVAKGSTLVGHVTEVQQKTKGNASSRLGLVFDRLEGQNMTTPITASIVSIMDVHAAESSADIFDTDIAGSASGSTRASGGTSSGGGTGGLLGGVTGTAGSVVNTTTQAAVGVAGTATQTLGGATQTVGRTLGGIQISQSASGSAQGGTTLSSSDKNIRLEKGMTFQLLLNAMAGN